MIYVSLREGVIFRIGLFFIFMKIKICLFEAFHLKIILNYVKKLNRAS